MTGAADICAVAVEAEGAEQAKELSEQVREGKLIKGTNIADRSEKVKGLSKRVQQSVRRDLRAIKRKRICSILRQFRGLRHFAGARQNNVKKRLTSVRNLKGEQKVGRQTL